MDSVIIEETKQSDLADILALYALPDMDNGGVISVSEATKIFEKMKTYPNYKIYVAKMDEKTIGTCTLLIAENIIHHGQSSGLVESMIVHTDYRSLGVGKKLIEFTMQKCKEAGCYKMSLSSRMIRERAHAFYERLGFRKHGYSFWLDF
jgi:GNAT superfamily N-acetyltransferase